MANNMRNILANIMRLFLYHCGKSRRLSIIAPERRKITAFYIYSKVT
jgi:hypothetical protein